MMTNPHVHALSHVECEVRTDVLTRQLYATDASIYQIEPAAVAFPKTVDETRAAVLAAANAGLSVTPRGAGSGLAGGAVAPGFIIDQARYNRAISGFDRERRTIRVDAGVVLDQLNAFLRPYGLWFGPDVATSSRATLGGMIANNSSGAHAPVYGVTADHVSSLDVVLADGRAITAERASDDAADLSRAIHEIVAPHADTIAARFPADIVKHWPGYGLDRYLRGGNDLTQILAGSEGTLAVITSAELRLVPLPQEKGLCVLFFASVAEAMQATVDILDLNPAAVEHIDRPVLEETKGKLPFAATRALLELDAAPCEALLIVEFYDDVRDRLDALRKRGLGRRRTLLTDAREMEMVWALRKAGLNLLTGRSGPAKPIAGLEDVAVPPRQLPEYVAALQELMTPLGLVGSFYGHAAAGLVHMRPIVDLHQAGDIEKFRRLSDDVAGVVKRFKGSIAAEHGVGLARAEYLADQVGPEVMDMMWAVKNAFDPRGVLNPGKVLHDGSYAIDRSLRQGAGHDIVLPFDPVLAFAAKDHSFVANLEQCNGCGGCRKNEPTMCPTYQVTGEEIMSTRGRANTIRAVLEGRIPGGGDPLASDELDVALGNCLSCKACTTECPSNVNLSLLKAELMHARQQRHGVRLWERAVSCVDWMNRLGCLAPRVANAALSWKWLRRVMSRVMGITDKRPLPVYAGQTFDAWFAHHEGPQAAPRGRVVLWGDTFVRYNEPEVGKAAVSVLEAAGYEVIVPKGRRDSGRPSFSVGRLGRARRLGVHNVGLVGGEGGSEPILFLEPSVYSMFVEDYRELGVQGADDVAARCVLFEQFIHDLLLREPGALDFAPCPGAVAIHTHCHAKALTDATTLAKLVGRLPGTEARPLETGCCGMAGSFGALTSKYDLSVQVAQPLVDQINALPEGAVVVACGTSCRQQITHLTGARDPCTSPSCWRACCRSRASHSRKRAGLLRSWSSPWRLSRVNSGAGSSSRTRRRRA